MPSQPLIATMLGPVETYSELPFQARPKTTAGEPGTLVALPSATVKRPPGPPPSSFGPEPAKTVCR